MLSTQSHAEAAPAIAALPASAAASAFRFVSWGDGQFQPSELGVTANQAASLHPAFTIWNGDLEQDGVTTTEMNGMVTAMGSLYGRTFLIRGNHDDHVSGSSTLWENYFTTASRPLPAGVTNYAGLNSSSTYLTYSFDYGNSRFIGVDVPGDADLLTNAEATFIDGRLTDAEAKGLTHAFIFFHGPEYCIANHCTCSAAKDGSCTPGNIVNLLNKHPIVSATFHGHEHVLGWVHMDSTRVAGLTRSYEEFFTSPAGGSTNNPDIFPARVNYYYSNMGSSQGFGAVDVNGSSFTIRLYKDRVASPVFSKTFTKASGATTAAFRSVAAYDGTLLESSENSNVGGPLDATGATFALGDDGLNRQFRAILSFNTASLPDNAVISAVTLRIHTAGQVGANPFATLGPIAVDIKQGAFANNPILQRGDFQVAASRDAALTIPNNLVGGWYSRALGSANFVYINKVGLTQFRLRFSQDDNNDQVADYLTFFSGDYTTTPAFRPILIITYSVP
jgi:hypothetical protein